MATGRAVVALAALGACAARFRRWPARRAGWRVQARSGILGLWIVAASGEDVRALWWAARAGRDD